VRRLNGIWVLTVLLVSLSYVNGSSAQVAQAPAATATLTVTRSNALFSLLAPVTIDLDGSKIANLGIGESYTVTIPSGAMVLGASVWSSPGRYSVKFTAEAGKHYSFLVSPRGEQLAAGMVGGMVGVAIDTAVNENSGPFKITPVN